MQSSLTKTKLKKEKKRACEMKKREIGTESMRIRHGKRQEKYVEKGLTPNPKSWRSCDKGVDIFIKRVKDPPPSMNPAECRGLICETVGISVGSVELVSTCTVPRRTIPRHCTFQRRERVPELLDPALNVKVGVSSVNAFCSVIVSLC